MSPPDDGDDDDGDDDDDDDGDDDGENDDEDDGDKSLWNWDEDGGGEDGDGPIPNLKTLSRFSFGTFTCSEIHQIQFCITFTVRDSIRFSWVAL